ncbi:MAG: hypothetical protein QNJ60_15015 [Xenococcaceae cyanobacterium MO_188.B19]|nr:hypothetical protein [Xenococcaceae cyanobacterium MO_188.B19]
MTESRKRIRKRGEKKQDYFEAINQEPNEEQPKPEIIKPFPEEEPDNFMTREQLRKAQRKYQVRKTFNEINADITDDKRSAVVESNYWDESHNWGSDLEVESDDYWHFVGRYE